MSALIRVLIADGHQLLRDGLANILSQEPDIEVVGQARDGQEAIAKAIALKPNVIVIDVIMPVYSGIEATAAITQKWPDAKVLMLTASDRGEDMIEALQKGALGYVLKSDESHDVVNAVKSTSDGKSVISPELTEKLIGKLKEKPADQKNKLSARETEVLGLAAEGLTDREIAGRLFISETTVRTYFERLMKKLNVKNRIEAAVYASRNSDEKRGHP